MVTLKQQIDKKKNKKPEPRKRIEDSITRDEMWKEIYQIIRDFRNTIHYEWKASISAYTMDKMPRKLELIAQKRPYDSNVYMPFVKNLVDKTYKKLYDTQIDFIINATDKQHISWEKTIKILMQSWFVDNENRRNFFSGTKQMLITGNWFLKAGIEPNGESFKQTIKNIPVFNLFFNVNHNIYRSNLPIVERSVMSLHEATTELQWLTTVSESMMDNIVNNPQPFSTYDDNRIWDMWARYNDSMHNIPADFIDSWLEDWFYDVQITWNATCEVVYRWTNQTLNVFINGYEVYGGINPLWTHPYIALIYDPSWDRNIVRWIASTNIDSQYELNALHNKVFDDVRLSSLNIWMKKWPGDIEGIEWKYYPESGDIIDIPSGTEFDKFNGFKMLDGNIYQVINNIVAQWESNEWLNSLTGGSSWWARERSAFAAQQLVATNEMHVKPAVEWMSMALTRIAQVWQQLIIKFVKDRNIDGKINVRTDDAEFKKIKLSDLEHTYDIEFSNKALVTLNNKEAVLDKINALNQLTPLIKDSAGSVMLDLRTIFTRLLKELWFDDDTVMTQEELIAEQSRAIDVQIALVEKQMELVKKQQELQSIMNPQPQAQPEAAPQWAVDIGNL